MRIETNRAWTVAELLAFVGGADPSVVVVFGKTLKSSIKGVCWCGCGGATGGKFVPGHDSKFHSLAKQVARNLAEMPEFVSDEAEADFLKWHDAEVPVFEAKEAAKAITSAAKAKVKADKAIPAIPAIAVIKSMEPLCQVKPIVKLDKDSAEYKAMINTVTMGK